MKRGRHPLSKSSPLPRAMNDEGSHHVNDKDRIEEAVRREERLRRAVRPDRVFHPVSEGISLPRPEMPVSIGDGGVRGRRGRWDDIVDSGSGVTSNAER